MDPVEPVRPDQPASLPRGPHPTLGPDTVAMPRWPGPLLAIGGALLAVVALGTGTLAVDGQIDVGDPSSLAWVALAGVAIFSAGLIYVAVILTSGLLRLACLNDWIGGGPCGFFGT